MMKYLSPWCLILCAAPAFAASTSGFGAAPIRQGAPAHFVRPGNRSFWQAAQDLSSQALQMKVPIGVVSQGPPIDNIPGVPAAAAADAEEMDPDADPYTTDTDLIVGN